VGGTRIKGVARTFWSPKWQRWITATWPRKQPKRTPAQKANQQQFKSIAQLIKYADPLDVIAAEELTKNTVWLTRDSLMSNALGRSIAAIMVDGTAWEGVRILFPDIQGLLNSLTDHIGSLIIRNTDAWVALTPEGTTAGQVLTSNGPDLTPDWQDPTPLGVQEVDGTSGIDAAEVDQVVTLALSAINPGELLANITGGAAPPSGVTLSDLIDMTGATEGDILFRSATGWEALALGSSGKFLASNGTTVEWDTPSGAGGYTPGTVPAIVQSAISNSGTASITLGAAPTNGNLLVCMFFNPSTPNVGTGWTQQFFNTTGTDYGVIATKVAGAGESATQTPIASSPGGTGLICMWELSGQAASDYLAYGITQAEFTGINNQPLQIANSVNCIGLSAVSLVTGANINKVLNVGNQDQSIPSSGNRRGVMGHTDLSSTPAVGIAVKLSASGNTKGATVLISS